MPILQNEIECLKCGDRIYSASAHDFKYCKCRTVAVDGGQEYLRRVGELSFCKEHSMTVSQEKKDGMVEAVRAMRESGRNDYGIALGLLRYLRDNDMLNMEKFKGE